MTNKATVVSSICADPGSSFARFNVPLLKHSSWIAVLVDTSTSWGRQIIAGIASFTKRYAPWKIMVEARGIEEHLRVPKKFGCAGVIARVSSEAMGQELKSLNVPVVNVSGIELSSSRFPRVTGDMNKVAQRAVEHFLERGLKHFGYFSLKGLPYVRAQHTAFRAEVELRGYSCAELAVATHHGAEPDWSLDIENIATWLKALPKPVAIFTWNASSAREVLYASLDAGLLVPDEVAVLSGSEDDLLCEASPIPISAVLPSAQMIGFRAAELLRGILAGKPAPSEPLLIPPLGIIARQSTDMRSIHDEALTRVLSYLQRSAAKEVTVSDLARHAGLGRRVLERKFRQILRRTPAEEIRRARLDNARRLLAETDMPISSVAAAAGFETQAYFSTLFGKHFGVTPMQYRKQSRPR